MLRPARPVRPAPLLPVGTRAGVMFLRDAAALPLPLAQRIAERYGPHTVERVRRDPYAALAGLGGLPFRCARAACPALPCPA